MIIALCVAVFLLLVGLVNAAFTSRLNLIEQREKSERELRHAEQAKQCIISEARRWKTLVRRIHKANAHLAAALQATVDDLAVWKEIAKDEIARNNRAFEAGVRAATTHYTGDEPTGDQI